MAADDPDPASVEDLVAAFLLEREEGRNPSIDDWLARHPKHAEVLAQLLSDDTASPATLRKPTSRGAVPPPPSDRIRLGPYEVLSHVSTAGGGTVYRARHMEAGHLVALKVLDSRGAVDPRDIERFHREAAMLRALNLVHVVPVLDAGEDGGRSWIAMKWLEGDTFSKLREAAADKSHRLHDLRERARLVARVARTFAAIHAYGILHRDVKPTNIMVDTTGEPMIIDFGIAHAPDLPELTTTIDQVMGTPRFLAPELLSGGNRQVSPKTDVYGLGLCLYELCTGTEAFKQEVRADLFTAIRTTGPAHPRKANPALSHDFAAVILRSIEIDPARRYPDMATFADDLDRMARGEAPESATLRGAHPLLRGIRRHKKRLIAAACLAAVLIPAGWLLATRALNEAAAREQEAILRPFVWFAPEAFAGNGAVLPGAAAEQLASNPAATTDQHLMAAWIPFVAGDVKGALRNLGEVGADAGFASRLFFQHLKALKPVGQGHSASTFIDPETKKPKVNPKTGEIFEVLFPSDAPPGTVMRDPADFDASVVNEWQKGSARTAIDDLVLATLSWSVMPQNPLVDTSAKRIAILDSLDRPIKDAVTRGPASHLRGVIRFLSGDFVGARTDFEVALSCQPAAVGTRYFLGITLSRVGDSKRAVESLKTVLRNLPASHVARPRLFGQLALAYGAAGQLEQALDACRRWRTECEPSGHWQDFVMPRVIAARLLREHGDAVAAKGLLVEAVHEDERIHQEDRELNERGLPDHEKSHDALILWGPPFQDLIALALETGDQAMVDEYRDRMASFRLQPMPKSAEAWLDHDLAGLRPADPGRLMLVPPPPPKNE